MEVKVNLFKVLAVGSLAATLTGCYTKPITPEEADPVPPDRLYGYQTGGNAQLIVTRDSGLFGSGCNVRFFIDGKHVADLSSGEVARFSMSAGQYVLGVTPSKACSGGALSERELKINGGEILRRRISILPTGPDISPTAF